MKRSIALCLCLSVCGALFTCSMYAAQSNDGFATFWQKFKTAVMNGDKKTVATLAKFPIAMSYGVRSIKSPGELNRRYRDLFSEQTDAAKCFATRSPAKEEGKAKRYSIACPDAAGNEVVIYEFERTKLGWKFVGLDNINE